MHTHAAHAAAHVSNLVNCLFHKHERVLVDVIGQIRVPVEHRVHLLHRYILKAKQLARVVVSDQHTVL